MLRTQLIVKLIYHLKNTPVFFLLFLTPPALKMQLCLTVSAEHCSGYLHVYWGKILILFMMDLSSWGPTESLFTESPFILTHTLCLPLHLRERSHCTGEIKSSITGLPSHCRAQQCTIIAFSPTAVFLALTTTLFYLSICFLGILIHPPQLLFYQIAFCVLPFS